MKHEICDGPECQTCCDHEYGWSEGYICLNCGHEGDPGEYIDWLEYSFDPER